MSSGKLTLAGIVAKQLRRVEMSKEFKCIKRNILRKNTGKHLLTHQLLAKCQELERERKAKVNLTTAESVVSS